MEPVLELRGLSKRYPDHCAVDRISLQIARGEFFSLVGPSGCGKTTTLRLIAGFEEPTAGEIRLNGRSLERLRPYQRNVSTVFQNYALFPHLTVRQNVEFGLRRRTAKLDGRELARRVGDMLDLVRLSGLDARYPSQISGGEKQRAALARSLAVEPDVLLLDEPLSALDPNLRRQVRAELKALQRRAGTTFLFVTHDREEALSISDRMAVMNAGAIEQAGAPEDLYLRPRSRFAAAFLGAVNWIGPAGVRPEALRISRSVPAAPARARQATVVQSRFLGNLSHIEARLEGGETVVAEVSRFDESHSCAPGDAVYVWWRPSDELKFE